GAPATAKGKTVGAAEPSQSRVLQNAAPEPHFISAARKSRDLYSPRGERVKSSVVQRPAAEVLHLHGTAPVANPFARRMRRLGQESQSCWRRQRATYPGGDIQMAITDRLAIDGGTPVRTTPLLPGWPGGLLIGKEEQAAVLEAIASQYHLQHYGTRPLQLHASLAQSLYE